MSEEIYRMNQENRYRSQLTVEFTTNTHNVNANSYTSEPQQTALQEKTTMQNITPSDSVRLSASKN